MNRSIENTSSPSLSIITISMNDSCGLLDTSNSICSQAEIGDYSLIEWIVVDGGSTDDSISILKSLDMPFRTRWISEADKGIFDAMNKGTLLSRGDYILFLNSGDVFHDNKVLNYYLPYLRNRNSQIYSGLVNIIYEDVSTLQDLEPWVNHQSVFVARTLLRSFHFDTSLKYFGDLDLWKRLQMAGLFKPIRLQRPVASFKMGGVGNNPAYIFKRLRERIVIADRYSDKIPNIVRLIYALFLYLVYRCFGKNMYYRILVLSNTSIRKIQTR